MNDRLKKLLEEAEQIKKKRVVNQERRENFLHNDMKVIREFAANCGAEVSFRDEDGFLRAKIMAPSLIISDMDQELKLLLMDDDISVTFQIKQEQVVMEIVLRTFYVQQRR